MKPVENVQPTRYHLALWRRKPHTLHLRSRPSPTPIRHTELTTLQPHTRHSSRIMLPCHSTTSRPSMLVVPPAQLHQAQTRQTAQQTRRSLGPSSRRTLPSVWRAVSEVILKSASGRKAVEIPAGTCLERGPNGRSTIQHKRAWRTCASQQVMSGPTRSVHSI